MLYCELGTIPLVGRRHIKMFNFWCGLVEENSKKLSSKVYKLMCGAKHCTWLRDIKKVFKLYGLLDLYNKNCVTVKSKVMCTVKKQVWDYHLYAIRDRLTGGKADFYNALSPVIVKGCTPWYLTNIDVKNISTLCNFRFRCHRLLIDKGAWMGLERANRICLCCGDVDNEHHFLFHCKLFLCNREKYIPHRYHNSDNKLDVYRLLLSEDRKVVDNTCVFIRKCLKVHRECYKKIEFTNSDIDVLQHAIVNNGL